MAVNSLLAKITLLEKLANWTHLRGHLEKVGSNEESGTSRLVQPVSPISGKKKEHKD